MDPEVKALALDLSLMNIVGDGVLSAAITSLAPQIKAARVIIVTPDNGNVAIGAISRFRAEAHDSNNRLIPG